LYNICIIDAGALEPAGRFLQLLKKLFNSLQTVYGQPFAHMVSKMKIMELLANFLFANEFAATVAATFRIVRKPEPVLVMQFLRNSCGERVQN
jgi:hypothetical protein